LWVYTLVAATDWKKYWKPLPKDLKGELSASDAPEMDELYDTMVEVIDVKAQRVVTRSRLPFALISVLPNGDLSRFYQNSSDELNRPGFIGDSVN
jgi:hypothetical protein